MDLIFDLMSYQHHARVVDRISEEYKSRRRNISLAANISHHSLNMMNQYSSPMSSRQSPIPAFTRTTSLMTSNPDDSFRSASKLSDISRSTTNVIAAFRELQAKAKTLESDRAAVFRSRDDLRDRISLNRQSHALWKTNSEAKTADSLYATRSATEQVSISCNDLQARMRALDELHESLQAGLTAQRSHKFSLDDDIRRLSSRVAELGEANKMLSVDAETVEDRCDFLDDKVATSPSSNRKVVGKLRVSLTNLEDEIELVRSATMRNHVRAKALERYIDLMVSINEDLCRTIAKKDRARRKILEYATR